MVMKRLQHNSYFGFQLQDMHTEPNKYIDSIQKDTREH
jgi:hypothetical protein